MIIPTVTFANRPDMGDWDFIDDPFQLRFADLRRAYAGHYVPRCPAAYENAEIEMRLARRRVDGALVGILFLTS